MKYLVTIVILFLSLAACEKIIDADKLIQSDDEVFIRSYISPQDTILRVHISRIFPSIGTALSWNDFEANQEKFTIRNAEVTLSDEFENSTSLVYSEEELNYLAETSSLQITENQRYFLTVIVDGKTYTASCEIPEGTVEIEENISRRETQFGDQLAEINFSFTDILGESNFYVLGAISTGTVQFEGEESQTFEYPLFFEDDEFLTDVLGDGSTLTGRASVYLGNSAELSETIIRLQVANVQEDLFQNLRSSSLNADSEGNPFAEYAIAPNNILDEGAVGVFAGYTLTEKEIEIDF